MVENCKIPVHASQEILFYNVFRFLVEIIYNENDPKYFSALWILNNQIQLNG